MHFNTHGGDITTLELSGHMALNEGGLADTAIADQHDLELNFRLGAGRHDGNCVNGPTGTNGTNTDDGAVRFGLPASSLQTI